MRYPSHSQHLADRCPTAWAVGVSTCTGLVFLYKMPLPCTLLPCLLALLPSPSCLLCGLRLSADLSILIRFVQSRSVLHVIVLARLEEPVSAGIGGCIVCSACLLGSRLCGSNIAGCGYHFSSKIAGCGYHQLGSASVSDVVDGRSPPPGIT